jgi:putative MATE family efflux protein
LFSNRDLRKLLIPLMLEQFLAGFMGIADTMMVTRVGDTAISAVSCVDSVNTLMLYLFSALATGGTIVCSQYLGREDRKGANNAARQVYFVAFCLSVSLMILCLVGRKPILSLVFGHVEEEIMTQSLVYFRITALSYPFLALQQTSAAQFRAAGNSKLPMAITAIANGVNIVGNGILIFVCNWGVAGAAAATLVSRILSCVALMVCQRKDTNLIYVDHYLSIRPDTSVIRLVLRIGIPTAVENGMFQFGRLVVQSTVSTLGTTAIAAQAMTYMMDSFQSMPSQAVGLGILTVLGQCLGAGRIEEAKGYLKKLCLVSEGMLIIMGVLIMLVVRPACVVSGLSTEATDLTVRLVLYITIAKVVLWVPAFSLPNGLRAAGDVNFTAIVSALSMWLVRVGLSFVLCRMLGVGLEGVWYAWFTDWVVRLCFYVYRYRSGKWLEKRVL